MEAKQKKVHITNREHVSPYSQAVMLHLEVRNQQWRRKRLSNTLKNYQDEPTISSVIISLLRWFNRDPSSTHIQDKRGSRSWSMPQNSIKFIIKWTFSSSSSLLFCIDLYLCDVLRYAISVLLFQRLLLSLSVLPVQPILFRHPTLLLTSLLRFRPTKLRD